MLRYGIRTHYHVWSIIDRETGNPVAHYGARGRGDAAARALAHAECHRLNGTTDCPDCTRGVNASGLCATCGGEAAIPA